MQQEGCAQRFQNGNFPNGKLGRYERTGKILKSGGGGSTQTHVGTDCTEPAEKENRWLKTQCIHRHKNHSTRFLLCFHAPKFLEAVQSETTAGLFVMKPCTASDTARIYIECRADHSEVTCRCSQIRVDTRAPHRGQKRHHRTELARLKDFI